MGIIFGRPVPDGRPARRKKKGAGRRKKKDEFLDSNRKHMDLEEDEEEPKLALKEVYKLLAQRRLATRKTLSVARWHPNRGLAEAMVTKGNMWQNMGIVRQGRIFCQPEEALYMVERGSLLLLLGSEPASVQQVYSLLLHQGRPLQSYHVYCNLRKLGYILQRYDTSWVYPVSQNRRKVDVEKKGEETGEEQNGEVRKEREGAAIGKGNGGVVAESSEKGGAGAGVKKKKGKEEGKLEKTEKKEKKEKKGKKEKGDGSKKRHENGAGSKDGAGNEKEGLRGATGAVSEQSANGGLKALDEPGGGKQEIGTSSEEEIPQDGNQADAHSESAQPRTDNKSGASEGAVGDPPGTESRVGENDGSISQEGTVSSARNEGEDPVSSETSREAIVVEIQDADPDPQQEPPDSEVGPSVPEGDLGLSEEAIANALTEDFRKGPVETAPTGRKREKPGPLDLNEASTFVNLNVKNYHPLAPYLFLGQPRKRKRPGGQTGAAANGEKGSAGEAGGENGEATKKGVALASGAGGGTTKAAAQSEGVEQINEASEPPESREVDDLVTGSAPAPRSDDVTIDIIEPRGEARDAPSPLTSAEAPVATLLTTPEETVDLGALHALLDLSRCSVPPPIRKPSTWQKLRWGLRRALRWRWWPWMWGRGREPQLGTGRTMRPLQRHAQEPPRGARPAPGGRVFPEVGDSAEVPAGSTAGGSEQQAAEGGGALYPEMWAADEGERLERIRARRSVVYDVWQPNSRFRKTDPWLPFFRLIISGTQPPTRRELHLYRELYGEEGVPLKYCFVEVTGASTFFSYETVALPSVL